MGKQHHKCPPGGVMFKKKKKKGWSLSTSHDTSMVTASETKRKDKRKTTVLNLTTTVLTSNQRRLVCFCCYGYCSFRFMKSLKLTFFICTLLNTSHFNVQLTSVFYLLFLSQNRLFYVYSRQFAAVVPLYSKCSLKWVCKTFLGVGFM